MDNTRHPPSSKCGLYFFHYEVAKKAKHEAQCALCQDGSELLVQCLRDVRKATYELRYGEPATAVLEALKILEEILDHPLERQPHERL